MREWSLSLGVTGARGLVIILEARRSLAIVVTKVGAATSATGACTMLSAMQHSRTLHSSAPWAAIIFCSAAMSKL